MKSIFALLTITVSLALTFFACNSRQAKTNNNNVNAVTVTDAWARPAAKGANSAVYLTIYNGTAEADTLLGVEIDAADMASVHQTYRSEKDMMSMRPADRLIIQPGTSLTLKPGGYHIMIMDLNRPLIRDDSLQLMIEFSGAGTKTVTVPVK